MKRFISLTIVCSLLFSFVSYADDLKIIRLKKGDSLVAPYDGRFVPDYMFENMVKTGLELKACNKKLTLIEQREKELCNVKLNYEKEKFNMYRDFYNRSIDDLEKILDKQQSFWKSPVFNFILGAVIAVATVWAVAYAFR